MLARTRTTPPSSDVFVLPGDLYAGGAPGRVSTLLGSCVSLVLWHPQRLVGGLCHFVLPSRPRTNGLADEFDPRYGEDAVPLLLRAMERHGADPAACRVHLFGGASGFDDGRLSSFDVGRRNIDCAERLCRLLKLELATRDVGGPVYRRLTLDLTDGTVVVGSGPMGDTGRTGSGA